MSHHLPRLIVTPGEPAGIGPDVLLDVAEKDWPAELVAVADPDLLLKRAKECGKSLNLLPYDASATRQAHRASQLKIIPVPLVTPSITGKTDTANATYVMRTLEIATDLCLTKQAEALVTGPIQKNIINAAKIKFTGHTEFLAQRCNVAQTIMLFCTQQTKVALLTTHLPLANVPAAISAEKIIATIRLLHHEMQTKFQLNTPKILVCGLNPHAGEGGYLGREEIDIIAPALAKLQLENIDVKGPLSADTIFTPRHYQQADVILAMYHDQALPVVKYMSFGHAVNVTLGLPFIRTSVDHGTALDIAGTGKADAGSLHAAINLALQLQHSR